MQTIKTKALVFAAIMAALGNVLSFLSIQLAPIAPNISLGPVNVSLALDLSHLSTFIAALFGGPVIGSVTGLIGGLVAAFEFGFSNGNLVTGIGLPLGKALTGLTAGYIFKVLYHDSNIRMMASTTTAYIPEGVLTVILFRYLLPWYISMPRGIATAISLQIVAKAFIEMIILGVIMISLTSNLGFRSYLENYFK